MYLIMSKLLFLLFYIFLASFTNSAIAAEKGPGGKTWKSVDELSPAEKEPIDLRTETPRDAQISYVPAEKYPFAPPYTAEEMAFRAMEFPHVSRWSHAMADTFGSMTSGGYLNQGVTIGVNFYMLENNATEGGVPAQIRTTPGKDYYRMVFYYTSPPESLGAQDLWVLYRTDQKASTKLDYFAYAPSLRRVRRLPQPRRGERFPNNVQSFDDIVGRDAWEFSWKFLGTDVLYETVRLPSTRPMLTLASPEGKFTDVPADQLKMMGDTYPFYRSDGGVECYVIEGVTRQDWLPNYSAKRIIYWLDRHYFYPLRIEQYDDDDRLAIVEVRVAKHENPALKDKGYAALISLYYDLSLDLMSYSIHDAHLVREWSAKDQEVVFGPDFMRRQWLMYPLKTQAFVNAPAEFYLRPLLHDGKFPQARKIEVAPEVMARIRAQEAAGHLVFETTVAEGKEP
ncbi:MAG: DUF1329 domain-containing protein [Deltaproteobacteria bacterium]|nr:DUF1329 domain-containing protein [Deltaproteobacteria bacterium]